MVRTWHPESRDAFHPVISDHQVFQGNEQGRTQMQLTCNVGWRNRDDVRFSVGIKAWFLGVILWLEITILLPPLIDPVFGGIKIKCCRYIYCCHNQLLHRIVFKQKSLCPYEGERDDFRGTTSFHQDILVHSPLTIIRVTL